MRRLVAVILFTSLRAVFGDPGCWQRCDLSFGTGTTVLERPQTLHHDARYPLLARLTCGSPLRSSVQASFLHVDYDPLVVNVTSALFNFYLEPWNAGLLRFNWSEGCYHEWFLIAGYAPDTNITWKCSFPLNEGGAADRCSSVSASRTGTMPTALTCQYWLGHLSGPSVTQDLMDWMEVDIRAMHCQNSTQNARLHCTSMDCTIPDVNGSGTCISCNNSQAIETPDVQMTDLRVTNIFGSAAVQREMTTLNIVVLPKPRYRFVMSSVEKRSAQFIFCMEDQRKEWLCSARNSMQYQVIVRPAHSTRSTSKTFEAVCDACATSCGETVTNATEKSGPCAVLVTALLPAARYVYEASWRTKDGSGTVSPSSEPALGSFTMPEDVPNSSPKFVDNNYIEKNCSASCQERQKYERGNCRELDVYWQSVSERDSNGELARIRLQTASQTLFLPRHSKSYTICTASEDDLQMWLTAENAVGAPEFSQWTTIRIPRKDQKLPPVADIIAKAGSSAGYVQLWWRYARPVDMFTIFWMSADDNLKELDWTVMMPNQLRRNGHDKWTLTLGPEHVKNASKQRKMTYGIGVSYGNQTSGLAFNDLCAFYEGDNGTAPEVQVLGQAESSATTATVDVELVFHEEKACSFAGPLIGFDVSLIDFDTSFSNPKARCDNCRHLASDGNSAYRYPRSITVSQLVPNHKYAIMFRSVIDAGDGEVLGSFSLPVYIRTSGLTVTETSGVVIGILSFCVLIILFAINLRRCHRAVGLGQKVCVPIIKRQKYSAMEELTVARTEVKKLLLYQHQTINDDVSRVGSPAVSSCDYIVHKDLWTICPAIDYAAVDQAGHRSDDDGYTRNSLCKGGETPVSAGESCCSQSWTKLSGLEPGPYLPSGLEPGPHLPSGLEPGPYLPLTTFSQTFSCTCNHTASGATGTESHTDSDCDASQNELQTLTLLDGDTYGVPNAAGRCGAYKCDLPSDYFQAIHPAALPLVASKPTCTSCSESAYQPLHSITRDLYGGSLEIGSECASANISPAKDSMHVAVSTRDREEPGQSMDYILVSSLQTASTTTVAC